MFDFPSAHGHSPVIALLAMLVCLPGSLLAQTTNNANTPKRVLALHVVRRDSPEFDTTLRSVLTEELSDTVDYYSEYIDLNRLDDRKYQSALRGYLRTRYAEDGVDLVIASGPWVVEFLNHDPSLFEGVPLVFTTRAGVVGGPHSTGIVSAVDFTSTIAAALEAQPNTKRVYVISGVGPFDRLYADTFRMQREPFAKRVTFKDLAGLPLADLEDCVKTLPQDSIVFYISVSDDGAGHTFMPLDAIDSIAAASSVPVYSWHEAAFGHGIVGGRLHSSVSDARETARLAVRVLRGERPESIPVTEIDSYSYQFDWRQLQRWKIAESRLPATSAILFREQSFFNQNRPYVVGGSVVFAAQLMLIGGLVIQRYRRQRAEESLRQSEARNGAILRAMPDLMFVMDGRGTYLDYHARDPELLFVPPETFLGKTIRDVMPPDLADTFMDALERSLTSEEPVAVNYELQLTELRHFEARLVRAGRDRVVSIVRDVTDAKRALELNRALARRLIVSQEEERQRIARELHDDLSQKIALLNLEVDQIADEVPVHGHRTRLEKLSSQVGEIASDLSHLSHDLHPSRLQTLGLIESLRVLCREFSQQRQLSVAFNAVELPASVDPRVALCLYRITQEALRNVAKHSRAREASVALSCEGGDVQQQIADSGVGFDPYSTEQTGLGLVSMRERVGILNGELVINASPGRGTRIGVRVPMAPPAREDQSIIKSA